MMLPIEVTGLPAPPSDTKMSGPWSIRAHSTPSSALTVDRADPKTGLSVTRVPVRSMSRWRESSGQSSGSIAGIVSTSSSSKWSTRRAISS